MKFGVIQCLFWLMSVNISMGSEQPYSDPIPTLFSLSSFPNIPLQRLLHLFSSQVLDDTCRDVGAVAANQEQLAGAHIIPN